LGAAESKFRTTAIRHGVNSFALTLLAFGAAHFLYIDFTASMISARIPWHVFWAWFTGVGHVAAGLSILFGVIPRIGATLLAAMFSGFVLFLHAPRVMGDIHNRAEWHMLATALRLSDAAWIVASALVKRPT
jgi:uncharacterized membrane protein YphA (DoxX/SURF4 family)